MFLLDAYQSTLSKLTLILREHDIRFHLTGGLTGTAYADRLMTAALQEQVRALLKTRCWSLNIFA